MQPLKTRKRDRGEEERRKCAPEEERVSEDKQIPGADTNHI